MTKQIPYPLLWDKMPVDISYIFESEKPAGKHGFLQAIGGKFIFEDGTKAKFWGTNFNSGANFPEHSHSEKVAKRLAMTGLNMVRFHQLDSDWATPNIFQFTKGKRLENTLSFDPESMDRLDYLVYCLKKEGIYFYMDFITYRRFKEGDGVANPMAVNEGGKPFSNFNRRMIELQKKYARDFLEHENPYTGLKYKDEPALALAELTNENDMFTSTPNVSFDVEPYKTELLKLYREFTGEETTIEKLNERSEPKVREFLCKIQMDYYREMYSYLKEIGVKFPLTGTNWPRDIAINYCNSIMDFTDSHWYWRKGDQKDFLNAPQMRGRLLTTPMLLNTVEGKPFFCSEWDAAWPNMYRADATLVYAAVGAMQDWGGFTIHTYRYGTNESEAVTGKIGRSIVIGNSYYRGVFDTYNDPAKFGLFYHAALMTRRSELKTTQHTVLSMSPEEVYARQLTHQNNDVFEEGVEERRTFRFAFDGRPSSGKLFDGNEKEIISDTNEIYRNKEKGTGYINTDMTKAVYGFAGSMGKTELSGVSIEVLNEFATVAISSLTDEKITNSKSMLLTAVGFADNTDAVYDETHTTLLKEGKAPVMIDVIEATICIKTDVQYLKVWSVDNEGYYTGVMPSKYEDGVFEFAIGKEFPSMYYLIEAQ